MLQDGAPLDSIIDFGRSPWDRAHATVPYVLQKFQASSPAWVFFRTTIWETFKV